jgi:hypothetical protein
MLKSANNYFKYLSKTACLREKHEAIICFAFSISFSYFSISEIIFFCLSWETTEISCSQNTGTVNCGIVHQVLLNLICSIAYLRYFNSIVFLGIATISLTIGTNGSFLITVNHIVQRHETVIHGLSYFAIFVNQTSQSFSVQLA